MGWMRARFIPFYADPRELYKIQSPVAMYLRTKRSANRGDLPTDMQASRTAEANRIFILCATG